MIESTKLPDKFHSYKKYNKSNYDSLDTALGETQTNSSINMLYTLQTKIMAREKEVDQRWATLTTLRGLSTTTHHQQFKKSENSPQIEKYGPRLLSTANHQDMQPNDDDDDI